MLKHCFLSAFALLSLVCVGQGRRSLPQAIQQGTLQEQFSSLIYLSRTHEEDESFKLIRRTNLDILRRNVLDSVVLYQKELAGLKEQSASSAGIVTALRDSVSGLDAQLQTAKQRTNNLSLFGIDLSSGAYHALVWLIIVALAAVYTTSYASFKSAKADSLEHKNTVEELQEELRALRKKSMEREQQLKRQLLDEQAKRS